MVYERSCVLLGKENCERRAGFTYKVEMIPFDGEQEDYVCTHP